MSAADKIAANARPHLLPGEDVQGAFAAQTSIRFKATDRYRTVVATDQRILVFDSGTFSQTTCSTLIAELARATPVGPPTGLLWHQVDLTGETLHVNRRFFKQVSAIDASPQASTGG